jgi:hypothetical protein
MRRDVVRAAVAIIAGVAFIFTRHTLAGVGLTLFGLVGLGSAWWFRDAPRVDPLLDAAIQEAMKVRKRDQAAADQMLDSAFTAAAEREERELTQLREKATLDRRAALDLRNRLRAKLKLDEGARRRAEKTLGDKRHGSAVLQELDRMVNVTRQRLAEAEQYVERLRTS